MSNKLINYLETAGLNWMVPVVRLCRGEDAREQATELFNKAGLPLIALLVFLLVWSVGASQVKTSLGVLPGPAAVWEQAVNLVDEHQAERAKADAFYQRQEERNAAKLERDPTAEVRIRDYTGKPTFIDQIGTSLLTVFTGFVLASLIAIPVGVACGLSPKLYGAISPLVQIFKPVSPLAWLPIVTMIVSATVATDSGISKSFLTSAITVTLCSLWPTLINTALGVASVDKDLVNVGKVLKLKPHTQITKLILPSALPLIFT
ncbi:MAG TPA: nitrate ABC transporter permease, partial [Pseudomonas sp.]|nr:nitrate ABC transporter permease [Pseudomonas sp.]